MTKATAQTARRRERRARARQAAQEPAGAAAASTPPEESAKAALVRLEAEYWALLDTTLFVRDPVALADIDAQLQLRRNDIYRRRLELGQ